MFATYLMHSWTCLEMYLRVRAYNVSLMSMWYKHVYVDININTEQGTIHVHAYLLTCLMYICDVRDFVFITCIK